MTVRWGNRCCALPQGAGKPLDNLSELSQFSRRGADRRIICWLPKLYSSNAAALHSAVMLAFSKHLPSGCKQPCFWKYSVPDTYQSVNRRNTANWTATKVIAAPAAAVHSSPKAVGSQQQPAAASRVLFVGGLPGEEDVQTLQSQLAAACSQCGHQPTLIEVSRAVEHVSLYIDTA